MQLRRLGSIIVKELRQLRRDRLTFAMIIGIPTMQLVLFGYAINTDVRHLRAAVADEAHTQLSRRLVADAHARGMKVVLDGVFNHVGTHHPAFRDVREKGQTSRFADWFAIKGWEPFDYEGWFGFGELPTFRKSDQHGLASESVRKHIYEVTRRWMDPDGDGDPSDGVDGWRLDVANEIPMPFWHEWCAFVRGINPDAYITGEIWQRADPWLDGKSFDAVMNYEFAKPAIRWAIDRKNKISASQLDAKLAEPRGMTDEQVSSNISMMPSCAMARADRSSGRHEMRAVRTARRT